ncbi:MAG TPA: hypothetical protein PL041_13470, partial [Melioribacteraceae bacterium]|nr:hypothetical protein [Melioribacteraceae bacterium]
MSKKKEQITTSYWEDDLFELACSYTFNNYKLKKVNEDVNANVTLIIQYNTLTQVADEKTLFDFILSVKLKANTYQEAIQLIGNTLVD